MISWKSNKDLIVIAHRGGSELFVENTLSAFRKVQELGVDAIEIDVHLTRDGKLAVIHDPDLKRMAGIDRFVSDMTYEELRMINLQGGEHVPDLETVVKEVGIPLVIELKSPETAEALSKIFASNPACLEKCIVISFFHEALKELKQHFPQLVTGALLVGFPSDPVLVAHSCSSEVLSFHFEGLTKEYVDRCHKGGIKVSVWTPNTLDEIRRAIATGVDSIASDRPDLVLKELGRGGEILK